MIGPRFLGSGAAILMALALVLPLQQSARAYEASAVLLEFNLAEDSSDRYMFQLAVLQGALVSPGRKDQIGFPEYLIGTVYKDTTTEQMQGLTRHSVRFYDYNALSSNMLGADIVDPRFGGSDPVDLPSEGDGGGDGGGGGGGDEEQSSRLGGSSFINRLGLPAGNQGPTRPGNPLQGGGDGGGGGGGGGGGNAGQVTSAVGLGTIQVTELQYVQNKRGEILDVKGLETLQKASNAQLITTEERDRNYIDINISHLFEWSHLLYVPEHPVYKDDIWFHSFPIHVPGLPLDRPIMTKFFYVLRDFRTVGTRKLAVIDMSGVAEWGGPNGGMEWETRTADELTEFKSWGQMGISTRYWFDYEKKTIFAMERPPFFDYQFGRSYGAEQVFLPYQATNFLFNMRFPGQRILMEFFYNTRVTDISGKPRLTEEEPEEMRRWISLEIVNQLEAE